MEVITGSMGKAEKPYRKVPLGLLERDGWKALTSARQERWKDAEQRTLCRVLICP